MPAGRPPIIPDPDLIDKVAGFVAAGHYMETACAFSGVTKPTYLKWLREGRKFQRDISGLPEGETITDHVREAYLAFLLKIERAVATAEVRDLTVIDKVAQGGLPIGQTTKTQRRVPMISNVTGEPIRDRETGEILFREETTEVTTEAKTLPVWTAAAWRLERRNPDRWSRYTKHHVSKDKDQLLPLDAMRAIIDGDESVDDGTLPDLGD